MSRLDDDFALTGAQIKEIRQKNGLSQQEFGARLGVTHAHISKIESGKENASETLLRLIRYEFNKGLLIGAPPADESKEKIQKYLAMLDEILLKGSMDDGCLYNSEFFLAAFITILRETEGHNAYQEYLLEALGGIVDTVALFLERTKNDMHGADNKVLMSSKLQGAKLEIKDCSETLYGLLEDRIK